MTLEFIPEIARLRIPLVIYEVLFSILLIFITSFIIVKSGRFKEYVPFVLFSFISIFEGILLLHLLFLTPYWSIIEVSYLIPLIMILIISWRKTRE